MFIAEDFIKEAWVVQIRKRYILHSAVKIEYCNAEYGNLFKNTACSGFKGGLRVFKLYSFN